MRVSVVDIIQNVYAFLRRSLWGFLLPVARNLMDPYDFQSSSEREKLRMDCGYVDCDPFQFLFNFYSH